MTMRHPCGPALVLGTIACLLGSAAAAAWDLECAHGADRRATVETTGATRVVIAARAGDLQVRPATNGTLVAAGRACASSAAFLAETNVRAFREGTTLRVEVLTPEQMSGLGISYATLDLTVDVPGTLPVEITDSSGDLEARDLRVARIEDSSGDIRLSNVRGDVAISDSSGDVRVHEAAGRVQVRDSSGDIVILGAQAVDIPSDSSGDIVIERIAGDVRIERDSSGDVRVSDVDGSFALLSDTSGEVRIAHVKGDVQVP